MKSFSKVVTYTCKANKQIFVMGPAPPITWISPHPANGAVRLILAAKLHSQAVQHSPGCVF